MTVVNTNVSASIAQAALSRNERALGTAMEQLSTGRKINSAADNASGLAISTRLSSQIRGLDQAVRNANDGISMVNTAEGALDEITDMLQRIRELAVQSGTGTTSASDRTYMNQEFTALMGEIDRIAENTQWNGRDVLDGTAGGATSWVAFSVGANAAQTISVSFGNFTDAAGKTFASLTPSNSATLSASTIASAISRSSLVITKADVALNAVSAQRAKFGAFSNRLDHAVDNLTNVSTATAAARSRILDTDYASATSELARAQIIQQAGTAMLAQANQLPVTVLALLQ